MDRFFVGVDLGQRQDYTALAVVARVETKGEWDAARFAWRKETALQLRYLERVPLGTPYAEVVGRVVKVTRSGKMAGRCELVVDETGVGRPVVELLERAGPGCRMLGVTITGGERETSEGGHYRVPKRDLITSLQVALECGELQIAAGLPGAEALVRELMEMKVKVTAAGNEQFSAREGSHDDLVLAVALAVWWARKTGGGGEKYWRNLECRW